MATQKEDREQEVRARYADAMLSVLRSIVKVADDDESKRSYFGEDFDLPLDAARELVTRIDKELG